MEKRIVILGAGESGCGAAVLAKKIGFDVFVSDYGTITAEYKQMLDDNGIEWEEKQHTEEKILNAQEIIKSPGIPNEAPIVKKACEACEGVTLATPSHTEGTVSVEMTSDVTEACKRAITDAGYDVVV